MITKLTDKQIARFAEFREKWLAIGLSTEPANRPKAEAAIVQSYRLAGLEPPKRIVWCGSPLSQGMTRAIILDKDAVSVGDSVWVSVGDSVGASVWASVWDSVRASVRASVGASVGASIRDSVWASVGDSVWVSVGASVGASVYGSHEAGWLSFYDYFREVTGLTKETDKLAGLTEQAKHAGWFLPHANICWVSERHNILQRDDDGRLHSLSGPAVAYPDGWSIYAVHGIRVPGWIIETPQEITATKIDAEENIEIRRIMTDIHGWPRYIRESGLEAVDTRRNHIEGTLEALYRCKDGSQRLVVTCPTGRVFALGVVSEVRTCEQAQRWLAGDQKLNVIGAT